MSNGGAAVPGPSTAARPALRLFIFFFLLYAAIAPGTIGTIDTDVRLMTTRAMWSEGTISISNEDLKGMLHTDQPRGYMHFGIGQSALMIPFDWAGHQIGKAVYPANPDYFGKFFLTVTFFPLVPALVCLMIFLVVQAAGAGNRAAVVVALLTGACTIMLPYSQHHYEESLVALVGLIGAYLVVRDNGHFSWSACAAMAAVTAIGFFVRPTYISMYAGIFLLAVMRARASTPSAVERRGAYARILSCFFIAGLVMGAYLMWYNWFRYGRVLSFGYTDFSEQPPLPTDGMQENRWGCFAQAFFAPLAASGRSVFLFSPVIIMGIIGTWRSKNMPAIRMLGVAAAVMFIGGLLVLGLTSYRVNWPMLGGWGWGPRYLVHAVPMMMIPAAVFFGRDARHGRRAGRAAIIALIAGSAAVQIASILFMPNLEYMSLDPPGDSEWTLRGSHLPARFIHVARWMSGGPPGGSAYYDGHHEEAIRIANTVNFFPFRIAAKTGWNALSYAAIGAWVVLIAAAAWAGWRVLKAVHFPENQVPG
jgi:hypothetical protein